MGSDLLFGTAIATSHSKQKQMMHQHGQRKAEDGNAVAPSVSVSYVNLHSELVPYCWKVWQPS